MVVGGVALLALRGGTGGRHWSVWVLGLPLAAALVRGAIQPAIKTGLALWHEPLAAAAIGYTLSTVVILLAGRPPRAGAKARPIRSGVLWFLGVGFANGSGDLPSLCGARSGLDHARRAAGRALSADRASVLSLIFLRGEQLHAVGLLGILVSVAGVIVLLVGGI